MNEKQISFNWPAIKKEIEKYFCRNVESIKDSSKGDQTKVYLITFEDKLKIILKIPLNFMKFGTNDEYMSIMLPSKQGWILKLMEDLSLNTPRLLYIDKYERFHIESYKESIDLQTIINEIDNNNLDLILQDVGIFLKGFHTIKTKAYGDFANNEKNFGIYDKWIFYFNNFEKMLKNCQKNLKTNIIIGIYQIYNESKSYLNNFNEPCLIHSDICCNNIRIKLEEGKYIMNGIIDFSDCFSGDPLYDIGRLFSHFNGNIERLKSIIKGYNDNYELFLSCNYKIITFYAIYFSVWMLSVNEKAIRYIENLEKFVKEYLINNE